MESVNKTAVFEVPDRCGWRPKIAGHFFIIPKGCHEDEHMFHRSLSDATARNFPITYRHQGCDGAEKERAGARQALGSGDITLLTQVFPCEFRISRHSVKSNSPTWGRCPGLSLFDRFIHKKW